MNSVPRTRSLLLPLALLSLIGSGCGTLDVAPGGTIRSVIVEPSCSTEDMPVVMTFNRLGNLTLNGRSLDLPSAAEDRYYGLTVVDGAQLPALWRPAHLQPGGVVVALLRKASPLALAGLRPFDRIRTVNTTPVTSPQQFIDILRGPLERTLTLEVTRHDGSEHRFDVRASGRVDEDNKNHVPFLFEHHDSTVGHSFGLGPLDLLFYYRVRTEHRYVASRARGHTAYLERFEWGALGNAILYERERDMATGDEKSRVRLLWLLSLGDL